MKQANPFPQLFHLADRTELNSRSFEAATQWAHATTFWTIAAALNKGNQKPPEREDVEALLWWIGPEDAKRTFVDLCCRLLDLMFQPPSGQQALI